MFSFSWNNKNKMSNTSNAPEAQKGRRLTAPYYTPPYANVNNGANILYSNLSKISNFQRSASREKLNQFTAMQQQHHLQFNQQNSNAQSYRHSLNNLMPFNTQQQQQNRRSSCGTDRIAVNTPMISFGSSEKIPNEQKAVMKNVSPATTTTTNMSDINSRLESLCLQMTEQAIN
jgi:hypothetical protein